MSRVFTVEGRSKQIFDTIENATEFSKKNINSYTDEGRNSELRGDLRQIVTRKKMRVISSEDIKFFANLRRNGYKARKRFIRTP